MRVEKTSMRRKPREEGPSSYEEGTQTDVDLPKSCYLSWAQSAEGDESSGSSTWEWVKNKVTCNFLSGNYSVHSRCTQTSQDPLDSETRRLVLDIVFYTLGRKNESARDSVTLVLRRIVSKMLKNHSYSFLGIVNKLQLQPHVNFWNIFSDVSAELFNQNTITWNRIIALFAFGARLAVHCIDERMEYMIYDIATSLADFAAQRLSQFLKQNGGWSAIVYVFPDEEDYETKIWRALLITGLSLGTAATILAIKR